MMAASFLFIALAAVLQLFVSYCRRLLAAYSRMELSERARKLTGIENRAACADEFERLFQLAQLCSYRRGDQPRIRATFRPLLPRVANWTEPERESCAYFAGVTLDRRIAYTRQLWAEQIAEREHELH